MQLISSTDATIAFGHLEISGFAMYKGLSRMERQDPTSFQSLIWSVLATFILGLVITISIISALLVSILGLILMIPVGFISLIQKLVS
jgi:hypothetical protein